MDTKRGSTTKRGKTAGTDKVSRAGAPKATVRKPRAKAKPKTKLQKVVAWLKRTFKFGK